MKARKELRILCGLTQEEMAGLLGVSASAVSMYEQGQRSLPTHAMVVLTAIENFRQSGQGNEVGRTGNDAAAAKQEVLKKMIIENRLMQLQLEEKILDIKQRHETAGRRNQISEFLQHYKNSKNAFALRPAHRLVPDVRIKSKKDYGAMLFACETKLALLQLEKEFLESRLAEKDKDAAGR